MLPQVSLLSEKFRQYSHYLNPILRYQSNFKNFQANLFRKLTISKHNNAKAMSGMDTAKKSDEIKPNNELKSLVIL